MEIDARTQRLRAIVSMRIDGLSYAAISRKLGISRQRVEQIISPPPEILAILRERSKGLCEHCGVFVGKSGHAHHKGNNGETYSDVNELEYLCVSCHRREHKGEHHEMLHPSTRIARVKRSRKSEPRHRGRVAAPRQLFCEWCGRPVLMLHPASRRSYCGLCCRISWQKFVCGGRAIDPEASVFAGVYWNKDCHKWMAYTSKSKNKKMQYLGLFNTEVDAARAYNKSILESAGFTAITNIIPQDFRDLLTK